MSALNYLLLAESGTLMAVILTLTLHAVVNRKQTDRLPQLFVWVAFFLFISNVSLFVRVFMQRFFPAKLGPLNGVTHNILYFIQNFCMNGAYYLFARRYSLLSFELKKLKDD